MKRKHALLLTALIFVLLAGACGLWVDWQQQQNERNQQLIAALLRDDTASALALVNAGADPNTRSDVSPNPSLKSLLFALLHGSSPRTTRSTALQLACGMLVEERQGLDTLFTPTHENVQLVQAMLARGGGVNALQSDKDSALTIAARHSRLHTVALLLQHGANANAQEPGEETPLMCAVYGATADVTRLLLAHGAKINTQNDAGETALFVAVAYSRSISNASELVAQGADPNLHTKEGDTPLTRAKGADFADLVRRMRRSSK